MTKYTKRTRPKITSKSYTKLGFGNRQVAAHSTLNVTSGNARKDVHRAFSETYKKFLAQSGRTEDFKLYQDRVSSLGARPEILTPPTTAKDRIAFSRFLYEFEARIGSAVEALVEICSVKRFNFTREITDDYFGKGDSSKDIFVSFLNWYFNDYLFFGKYKFPFIYNAALVDWFLAGEQVYYYNDAARGTIKFGDVRMRYPISLIPVAPEYLEFLSASQGFGIPMENYELRIPADVQSQVLDSTELPEALKGNLLSIPAQFIFYLRRKNALHQNRGKSIVAATHDPIRIKTQKKLDTLAHQRASAVREILLFKYGEIGIGEEGFRDQEELEEMAAVINGQIDSGSAAMVVPPDMAIEQATPNTVVDNADQYKDENESIQIAMRVFDAFLIGTSAGTGSGTKDLTLAIISDRIETNSNEIISQVIPQLVENLAAMNKSVMRADDIDTRGIVCQTEKRLFAPAAYLAQLLSEWERGIRSTEDYLGSEYQKLRTNRTSEHSNGDDKIFITRQLPHTLSSAPAETPTEDTPEDEVEDADTTTSDTINNGDSNA